jgi:hypothetical protein
VGGGARRPDRPIQTAIVDWYLRYLLTHEVPTCTRILLIESGSRHLYDRIIPRFHEAYGEDLVIDLVTCYAGVPHWLNEATSKVYRVSDFQGSDGRRRLVAELRSNGYQVAGIVCSAEPIMTKWKWMLAARVPAKLFIANENGDYLWVDRVHRGIIRRFVFYRLGLTGANAVTTLASMLLFPFTVLYLLLYAAAVHLRRKVHT